MFTWAVSWVVSTEQTPNARVRERCRARNAAQSSGWRPVWFGSLFAGILYTSTHSFQTPLYLPQHLCRPLHPTSLQRPLHLLPIPYIEPLHSLCRLTSPPPLPWHIQISNATEEAFPSISYLSLASSIPQITSCTTRPLVCMPAINYLSQVHPDSRCDRGGLPKHRGGRQRRLRRPPRVL